MKTLVTTALICCLFSTSAFSQSDSTGPDFFKISTSYNELMDDNGCYFKSVVTKKNGQVKKEIRTDGNGYLLIITDRGKGSQIKHKYSDKWIRKKALQ